MPTSYRIQLAVLMVANLFLVCAWEYFIVNGSLPQTIASKFCAKSKVDNAGDELRSSQTATKIFGSDHEVDSEEAATSDQSDSKHVEPDQSGLEAA